MTTITPDQEVADLDWALPGRDEGNEQLAALATLGQRYGELMATHDGWTYKPPATDDWREWTGALRYAALTVRSGFVAQLYRALVNSAVAIYCPRCMEPASQQRRAVAGWSARTCVDCDWETRGYDNALSLARLIGRQEGGQR